MKFILGLCAIALVSALKQEEFQIPPESLIKLHSIAVPCAVKFKVDTAVIRKLGGDTLPRDEATDNFLHCYSINSGFVDEVGHIIVDRLVGIVGDHPLKEEFRKALTKCNDITKENPVATTVAMHDCYAETSPLLYVF